MKVNDGELSAVMPLDITASRPGASRKVKCHQK